MVKEVKKQPNQSVEVSVVPNQIVTMLYNLISEGLYPDKKWKDVNQVLLLAQQNTQILSDYIANNDTPYCLKKLPKTESEEMPKKK